MDGSLTRRAVLAGGAAALLLPRRLAAQPALEREHRPQIEMPILAEDATAVPVRVWVEHPMEADHLVRSIEVTVETDPVANKGRFLFTPANGRAAVAFTMRSGAGGRLRAVAECTRHGRFAATREYRVADGGCATEPGPVDRSRFGNPQLRLAGSVRPGEVVEVRTRVDHPSHTGLALKAGRYIRERPPLYLARLLVLLDEATVSEFHLTEALSPNPILRFPLRVTRGGTLRVVYVNSEGRRWEAAEAIPL